MYDCNFTDTNLYGSSSELFQQEDPPNYFEIEIDNES